MTSTRNMAQIYPLLTQSHSLEPTWASDTGRNSNSGKFGGTFIGYFSQVIYEFGPTTRQEMIALREIFEKPIISLTYVDSKTLNDFTEDFYGTAITAKFDEFDGKYDPFNITLTAIERRE